MITRADIDAYFANWTPDDLNDLPEPIRHYVMRLHSHFPDDELLLTRENEMLYGRLVRARGVVAVAPRAKVSVDDQAALVCLQFEGAPAPELQGSKWDSMMGQLLAGKTVLLIEPEELANL